ncbi:hypothetical protein ACHAXR_005094 [Thalassiosira sp. AJA248-18]
MVAAVLSRRITCMVQSNVSFRCVSGLPTYFPSSSTSREHKNCQSMHVHVCQGDLRHHTASSKLSKRCFSNPSSWEEEYEGLIAQRNKNIIMHPEGLGQKIVPGNFVIKKNPKTGAEKKVILEHALGYFWAFKDLTVTDKKPILSNETLIPAAEAEKFPVLKELVNLHEEVVDIPDFFTRNNRSKDANAQCTLVAISCKEFGANLLSSWTEPYEKAFCTGKDADRFEVVRITINEGRIEKLLSPFIVSGTKRNVPEKDHANTLLYYGDAEEMRDILRMHNIYTGYVFLVDGIGRVRWAGSGEGSDKEVQSMIEFAEMLTQPQKREKQLPSSGPRRSKKVPSREA